MTDAQIVDDKFLVSINNILASGNVPGLFEKKIKKVSAVASEPQRRLQAFKIHQITCTPSLLQELESFCTYLSAFRL